MSSPTVMSGQKKIYTFFFLLALRYEIAVTITQTHEPLNSSYSLRMLHITENPELSKGDDCAFPPM